MHLILLLIKCSLASRRFVYHFPKEHSCPICGGGAGLLDVLDLNKSCGVEKPLTNALAGVPIYYALCRKCFFCWAPEMYAWTLDEFSHFVYNDSYVLFDPAYVEKRPLANSELLRKVFPDFSVSARHLDYGGGNGVLSNDLVNFGWNSFSYDPFVNQDGFLDGIGQFDLISAFEVFEHVPNVHDLMSNIVNLLSESSLVLFSTLLSDGNLSENQRITWWYASPRNGHISLFSSRSLVFLARVHGLSFGSISNGLHVFWKGGAPSWARSIFRFDC